MDVQQLNASLNEVSSIQNAYSTSLKEVYHVSDTASGEVLPLYTVYKAEHLWDKWRIGGSPNAETVQSQDGSIRCVLMIGSKVLLSHIVVRLKLSKY